MENKKRQLTPVQVITLSFLAVVLSGGILLSLPIATRAGQSTTFIEALFTSTSASCVTGLVVFDTYMHWTLFGQIVILALIQIGGIGIITLAMYFLMVAHAKIGMRNMFVLQESIGAESTSGVIKMTRFIAYGILMFEGIGALLLMPVFIPEFGISRGIYYSIFHSVSAFCNAGFDLMGINSAYESFLSYSANAYLNIVIMLLIVTGGLGFFVWGDLKCNKLKFRKYALHTKVVVITTLILIFGGATCFYLLSYDSLAMIERGVGENILVSLFQSVTARTAGFATIDLTQIRGSGKVLMMCLMLIGGSSGSTAGGVKTTTIAILFLYVRSIFRKKEDVDCFGRRVNTSVIRTAVAIFVLYLLLALVAGVIISDIEGLDVIDCLFETFSAIATVGLSLSVTPQLGSVSQLILIVLMFLGRVGGLTVLLSLAGKKESASGRYPVGNITVG